MKPAFNTWHVFVAAISLVALAAFLLIPLNLRALDSGESVDLSRYANRQVLADFTAAPCPDNPRSLTQINGNLYRHTTGAGLAVHSGFVLVTKDGALVIDPAMTCTAGWLRDEINSRFHVKVKYVVYTHAHADHISGAQIFQQDGAIVIANSRALARIFAVPDTRPLRASDLSAVNQRHDDLLTHSPWFRLWQRYGFCCRS